MRISASYSQKMGTANYGSIGALVTVEEDLDVEFAENPSEAIRQKREELMAIAREGVLLQLQAEHGAQPSEPPRQNHQEGPPARQGSFLPQGNQQARSNYQPPRPPSPPSSGRAPYQGNRTGGGGQGSYNPDHPKTGSGLFKWAKTQEEQTGSQVVKFINQWGRENSLSGPWRDWPVDAIQEVLPLAQGFVQDEG